MTSIRREIPRLDPTSTIWCNVSLVDEGRGAIAPHFKVCHIEPPFTETICKNVAIDDLSPYPAFSVWLKRHTYKSVTRSVFAISKIRDLIPALAMRRCHPDIEPNSAL